MRYEEIKFLGKKVPLVLNHDLHSETGKNYTGVYETSYFLKKGDNVKFHSFFSYDGTNKIQRFSVELENGEKALLSQQDVEMTFIPYDIEGLKPITYTEDFDLPVEALVIDTEFNELGLGQRVTITDILEVHSDNSVSVRVMNEWGGIDDLGLDQLAFYPQKKLERKEAVEIGIQAIQQLLSDDSQNKNTLKEAIKQLNEIKEYL